MDLKGMLNDGPAGQEAAKSSPDGQRERMSQPGPAPPATLAHPATPSGHPAYHSAQQPPLFPPPSASPVRHPYPYGQTQSSHSTGSALQARGQYTLPQHPSHSLPAAIYRSPQHESPSASAPFPRPASHSHQYPPSAPPQIHTPILQRHTTTSSLSPTPPSSRSPYNQRPSPSARPHPPSHQVPPQQQYQQQQSSAPFVPPPPHRQPSGAQDAQSPFHQPSYSGASNGIGSASPESVSPKTKALPPPRPLSQSANMAMAPQRASLQNVLDQSSKKRPADSEDVEGRPSKRMRQRPIWAVLSKHNPRYRGESQGDGQSGAASSSKDSHQHARPNGETMPRPSDSAPPWSHDPPLDHDLMHARRVLGQWEKTFRWNTPYESTTRVVSDWLFHELQKLGDVGRDPRQVSVEIEAKFGTLMEGNGRYFLPVRNACVIDPAKNEDLRFDSTMSMPEHQYMNKFLNEATQASMESGRVKMSYLHTREIDSFHSLSPPALAMLPRVDRRQSHRPPRLRVTKRINKDGTLSVTARIVKLPISNLHILNPGYNYDCRISINLEVNLDRPDLSVEELIDSGAQQAQEVDRNKDRISYKHLAYSIDLTKVERLGLEASHELELEVDSNVLRAQMTLMKEGKPHAFGDVVGGFWDNATFLMRTRPPRA